MRTDRFHLIMAVLFANIAVEFRDVVNVGETYALVIASATMLLAGVYAIGYFAFDGETDE